MCVEALLCVPLPALALPYPALSPLVHVPVHPGLAAGLRTRLTGPARLLRSGGAGRSPCRLGVVERVAGSDGAAQGPG